MLWCWLWSNGRFTLYQDLNTLRLWGADSVFPPPPLVSHHLRTRGEIHGYPLIVYSVHEPHPSLQDNRPAPIHLPVIATQNRRLSMFPGQIKQPKRFHHSLGKEMELMIPRDPFVAFFGKLHTGFSRYYRWNLESCVIIKHETILYPQDFANNSWNFAKVFFWDGQGIIWGDCTSIQKIVIIHDNTFSLIPVSCVHEASLNFENAWTTSAFRHAIRIPLVFSSQWSNASTLDHQPFVGYKEYSRKHHKSELFSVD